MNHTDDYIQLAEREVKERGAKTLKWDPFWGCDVFTSGEEDIRKVIDNVARVRRAVGDDVELMLDCHSRMLRLALRILWFTSSLRLIRHAIGKF